MIGAGEPVAAIDCGTNSIRLLIAYRQGSELVEVERRTLAVRLGEGVHQSRVLAPQALRRTWDACEVYREVIADHGVGRVRFVATSATRDASNAGEFVRGVRERLGVEPEVITGEQEAILSFDGATRGMSDGATRGMSDGATRGMSDGATRGMDDGATRGMNVASPALVFDIGGGSTEFVLGGETPWEWASVDMGCVRLTERFVDSDPLSPGNVAAIEKAVDVGLDSVSERISWEDAKTVIGLAGTVTTVAALALGLSEYDSNQIHGSILGRRQVNCVVETLVSATTAQRRESAVMKPGRADVIVAGALILRQILARCGAESLVVSEHDILDGLAWSLASSER